jgi:hypothetical protein
MKYCLTLLLLALALSLPAQNQSAFYELRIYQCYPGRLDALIARFEQHTLRLFEKHGMTNVGYWLPAANDNRTLYYILAYPDQEARNRSWAAFSADPAWQEARTRSEADGKTVEAVTSVFMKPTDLVTPNVLPRSADRYFEWRSYTCLPGRLPALMTRFRDHTLKLFEKHGIENVMYFTTVEAEGVQPKLVYLVAHASEEAAAKSWADFIVDPQWIAVRDASEKDGKIIEKLESVYLKPLPFSKWK